MLPSVQDLAPQRSPEVERLAHLVRNTLADSFGKGMDRFSATRRAADAVHRSRPDFSESDALAAVWRFRELGR